MSEELTLNQIAKWKIEIDCMSQEDMARLWRYAPPGHPVFVTGSVVYAYFSEKFQGFNPALSKKIG